MWWYGRVGEIVFFFVFLFAGCVGNCDFLFTQLGMDVCKQTFLLVQPLLSKRRSAGAETVLVQKHLLAAQRGQ